MQVAKSTIEVVRIVERIAEKNKQPQTPKL